MSCDLQLDNVVEVGEGEKYMTAHARQFTSFGFHDSDEFSYDVQNNKIVYTKLENLETAPKKFIIEEDYFCGLPVRLRNLVRELENNRMLFAEIDYLLRNTPKEETLNIDLKLMTQNLNYFAKSYTRKFCETDVILMHQHSPLSSLGFIAQMLYAHQSVTIVSTKEVAVLCHLFVSLCHKNKLTNVHLAFVKQISTFGVDVAHVLCQGSVGVVTDRADVDSAVDAFLSSATKKPWKITRILVQECICDRFKEVLSWKAERSPSNSDSGKVEAKCSQSYVIKGKKFYYEYCSDGDANHGDANPADYHIHIEAYRTVKELISFLNKSFNPVSVSLWCSDVSQSNEIAHGIDSKIIWINDYGCFQGPSKSSQAFYSIIENNYCRTFVKCGPTDDKQLMHARSEWSKLTEDEKCLVIDTSLKEFKDYKQIEVNNELLPVIDGSFVKVGDGCMCVGMEIPNKFVLFADHPYRLLNVLRCVFKNTAVLYLEGDPNEKLFRSLSAKGVPIQSCTCGGPLEAFRNSESVMKVVRTSFGTIFAN